MAVDTQEFKFIDAADINTIALIRARTLWNGPSGAGKTFSSLKVATALAELLEPVYGYRPDIYGVDSERESMLLYRKDFKFKYLGIHPPYSVSRYLSVLEAIRAQARPGDIVLIDSLSHPWMGPGGILERVDKETQRFAGNSWAAWSVLTPEQNKLIDSILALDQHLFATTRSKSEWADQEVRGKKQKVRIGTLPIQREGLEYEFTAEFTLDRNHTARVGKTRIASIDDKEFMEPGKDVAQQIFSFLMTGKGDASKKEIAEGIEKYRAAPPKVVARAATVTPAPATATPTTATTAPVSATSGNGQPKASAQTVETSSAPATSDAKPPHIIEHERLAGIFVAALESNDTAALRKFPKLVSEAAASKKLDRAGYDDLVSMHGAWKKNAG